MTDTIDVQQFAERRKKASDLRRMLDFVRRNAGSFEGEMAYVEVSEEVEENIDWILAAAESFYATGTSCCWCHRKITGEEAKYSRE